MREVITSMVMAADRPYGEFYDFYIVNPEYFGYSILWLPLDCFAMTDTYRPNYIAVKPIKMQTPLYYFRGRFLKANFH
jgi:hypothetical protein